MSNVKLTRRVLISVEACSAAFGRQTLRHSQEMTQVCSRKVTHGGTTKSIRFGARQTPGGRFEQHAIVVVLGK
jgi:hypothetical protein